jgi:hypothetical protein
MEARNLIVVPEFATQRSASLSGITIRPATARDWRLNFAFFQFTSTRKPNLRSESTITSVSSLCNAPESVMLSLLLQELSAASTSARLVMLLLPGTVTVADGGLTRGVISSSAG